MATANGPDARLAHLDLKGPGDNTGRGMVRSLLVSTAPAALVWFLLAPAPLYVATATSLVAFGISSGSVFKTIENQHHVPLGYVAVSKVLGEPTGELLGPGDYSFIPIIESAENVNMKDQTLNPPPFEEMARDRVNVVIDGYLIARVYEPLTFLSEPEEGMETLKNQFDSETRKYASQWRRASDIVYLRDLMPRFLDLPSYAQGMSTAQIMALPDDDKIKVVYLKHRELVSDQDDKKPLSEEGFRNLWEDAGMFRGYAECWGIEIEQIHLEKVNLPERLRKAAEERAAQLDQLETYELIQAKRLALMEELRKKMPNLTDRDVMDAINLVMKIPVNRTVNEIELRGLNLPQDLTRALANALNSLQSRYGRK